ncbi:hypothetical protein P2318_18870 [Myxococcaceae bacterium GXIMD 01537]
MRRFPLRTVLLMVIALLAFLRLWFVTHADKPRPETPQPPVAADPAASCRTLDRAVEAAIRAPDSAKALLEARVRLESCPSASQRACELGAALDARSPLAEGDSPLRDLLASLCRQCPAAQNPCAEAVSRSLGMLTAGAPSNPAELRWNLEHAGPAQADACGLLTRALLAPAAVSGKTLSPEQRAALGSGIPVCSSAQALPAAVVNAAAAQQGAEVPELAKAVVSPPAAASGPVKPDEVLGAPMGRHAVDSNERSGVDLGLNATAKRWEADGALRLQFNPPLKQLASVRVRASGPGTLRAIIRTPPGVGLKDPERDFHFVNPTVCRFKGTGQWESCALDATQVDVDALSVFPAREKISFYEVEPLGVR